MAAGGQSGGPTTSSMEELIRQRLVGADDPEAAYKQFLEDARRESEKIQGKPVKPEPGFCMKTTREDGSKVFINYCYSDKVWPPKNDATDAELEKIIETGDNTNFFRAGCYERAAG